MVTHAASIPWPTMVPRICVFRGGLLQFSLGNFLSAFVSGLLESQTYHVTAASCCRYAAKQVLAAIRGPLPVFVHTDHCRCYPAPRHG